MKESIAPFAVNTGSKIPEKEKVTKFDQMDSIKELMRAPQHKAVDFKGAYGRPALTM